MLRINYWLIANATFAARTFTMILATLAFAAVTASAQNYLFERSWPNFNCPEGVAVDADGNIIVADTGNHCIQVFSSNGAFLHKWGALGSGDGQFNYPSGVAVDAAGNIIVVGNHDIQVFSSNGVFLRKWGTEGSGDGQFNGPEGVAVDDAGNIIIADFKNHRIQVFDPGGSFLTKFGSEGSENGFFHHPAGVACDAFGNVYVADYNNNRIQKFAKAGGVPGAAVLLSPNGAIGTATPAFSWNAVPFATWYQLWVDDAQATPKIRQWFSAEQAGCSSGTGTCFITPSVTLAPGAAQ